MSTEGTSGAGDPTAPGHDDEHLVRRRLSGHELDDGGWRLSGPDPEDEHLDRRPSGPEPRTQGADPPERIRQDARDAYALRRPGGADAIVAALTADSAFSTDLRASSDLNDDDPRYLTFRGGTSTVRLEVTGNGRMRDIVGQILPGRTVEVEVHWPRGHRAPEVDGDGAFVLHGVPAGPVSLVVRDPTGESITTRWTRV